MVKSELITAVINKLINEADNHLSVKDIELSVNKIIDIMADSLGTGGRIEIRGFGSFCLHYHPPRKAHNPKTGDKLTTIGKYSPHFKPGKELREKVSASRTQFPLIVEEHDE